MYVLVFISMWGFKDVTIQNTNQLCVTITITTWSALFVCEVGATAHKGHLFRFPSVPSYTSLTVLCCFFVFFFNNMYSYIPGIYNGLICYQMPWASRVEYQSWNSMSKYNHILLFIQWHTLCLWGRLYWTKVGNTRYVVVLILHFRNNRSCDVPQ